MPAVVEVLEQKIYAINRRIRALPGDGPTPEFRRLIEEHRRLLNEYRRYGGDKL